MNVSFRKHRNCYIICSILLIVIVSWAIWVYLAFLNVKDKRSDVILERHEWYQIEQKGKPILYFSDTDTTDILRRLTESRDSAQTITRSYGHWANRYWWLPWSKGRLVAAIDSLQSPTMDAKEVLTTKSELIKNQLLYQRIIKGEMDYYFSVHSVQDEGYMLVTAEYERHNKETERLKRVLAFIEESLVSSNIKITHRASLYASYKDENGKKHYDTCRFDGQFFRLNSDKTPSGVKTTSFFNRSHLGLSYVKAVVPHPLYVPLDGFALRVTHEKGVQLGEWKDGKFKGERLEHNSNRIYGIDISRFQHDVGRKHYSINWKKLRIVSLGTLSKKKISGTVDYKVSFCYIKSTEGKNIKNRYYTSDYHQARKHGFKIGTYHFFSTKSPAEKQAHWFLRNSKYLKGDIPPVLDLEPTNAQVKAMGGPEVMFREVRKWLHIVEKRWGVKPILYISQAFVRKYLPLAPDLKENYNVWIARYGEYKPDVHMVYWQLSPDGKVAGIVPEVDINVFNGYNAKYEKFLDRYEKR